MIAQFSDIEDVNAHDRFQAWRHNHEHGFFINCKSATNWMLHRTNCPHHGDTGWMAGDWGSLTNRKKLCSNDKRELVDHARKSDEVKLKLCNDCKP